MISILITGKNEMKLFKGEFRLKAGAFTTACSLFVILFAPLRAQEELLPLPDMIKKHISYLASDELEGRYPGTDGNKKAADYIAAQFQSIGLEPLNGSYRQALTIATKYKPGSSSQMSFDVIVLKPGVPREMLKPITKKWEIGTDWMPMSLSDNGQAKGEMMFVGYGITAKDLKYDDYEGIDVKGKIVICLTESPDGEKDDGPFSSFSKMRYKATNAREHGALGVIFIKINSDSANVFEPLTYEPGGANSGILVIQANRTSIAKFFPRNVALFPIEQEINKTRKPKSFPIPDVTVNMSIDLVKDPSPADNVVGMIKGSDPVLSNEYIIIGAHFDHLGWGGPTSYHKERVTVYGGKIKEIHNGADDNASGVAGLIELARNLKTSPPKRSVIFIAFNGEEFGLVGSEYYVNNPLAPLDKSIFMLNFDMIGRLRNNTISLFGTGSSPVLNGIADSLSAADSIQIVKSQFGFGPSDHSSFYRKQIPVTMIITGVHEDYHKPTDDVGKINFKGEAHVLRFAESLVRSVADLQQKPGFTKAEDLTDHTTAEPAKTYASSGAWFGIVPNFEDNPKGCKINGASPGSPAQKAGLIENDVITKFGDVTVKNLQDISFALKKYKPGDKVIVSIIRGDKTQDIEVVLSSKK